jgi:hypothetical protein
MYDVAITGLNPDTLAEEPIPFLIGSSEDYPYIRESDGGVREQIDTSAEAGEQSLTGMWWRSQASFDLGTGLEFFDTARDESVTRRFKDSCGVDVFTPGKVTLLNATSKVVAHTDKTYAAPYMIVDDDGQVTEDGVLVAKSTFGGTPTGELLKYTSAGVTTSLLTCDAIYDFVVRGPWYYVMADDGVHLGNLSTGYTNHTMTFQESSGQGNVKRGRIAYTKDRFLLAVSQESNLEDEAFGYVYEKVVSNPWDLSGLIGSDFSSAILKVEIDGWRWTGICEGPNAIYMGGYAGNLGRIYAATLDESTPPVMNTPWVVAELPQGEIVSSVITYMGTYMVIGTNYGVRIATINPDSSLTMGPLSVKSDTPVWGLCASGDFVYASGSSAVPHGEVQRPGLFRINLGVDGTDPRSQLGIFPAARDLYAVDADNPGVNQVLRVCPFGNTGRMCFTVDNHGLYVESTTEVPTGWLQTGRIRFDTQEKKAFAFLRVNRDDDSLGVTPLEEHEGTWGAPDTLTWLRDEGLSKEFEGQHTRTDRLNEVRYKFVLTRGDAGAAFTGYQLRALPSNVVGRTIRLPLLCYPREKSREGLDIERGTWRRIHALELMEKKGGYVRLQNLNTGEDELCTFESIQFVTTHTQQSRQDQADPGGMLLVTLKVVNV